MMWRSGVLILALSLACPTLGQQKDNAAQIATDPNASHADQPPSPNEVVKAMGEIAVPQLLPLRPRPAKLAPGSLTNEQVKQLINQVAEKDIEQRQTAAQLHLYPAAGSAQAGRQGAA